MTSLTCVPWGGQTFSLGSPLPVLQNGLILELGSRSESGNNLLGVRTWACSHRLDQGMST